MGNSASVEPEDELDQFDGIETLGYRVLGVQPDSPASQAGLVSFFDFILGANGEMLLGSGEGLEEGDEYDDVDFPALLQENKGRVVELLVWNIKAQQKRLVELTPDDNWGGAGLLGVTIKLDNYGGADERLIRVLEIEDDSPASIAGLVPLQDFILGTTVTAFADTAALSMVLRYHLDQVVELYVYNAESDVVRVVALMPTLSWGGHGLLGAEVGTGYLHGLPQSCRSTVGKSVQRKVRLRKENENDRGSDNGLPEPPESLVGADATRSETTLVEMEPHLEMERSESDDRIPEQNTRQPYELGAPVTGQRAGASSAEVPSIPSPGPPMKRQTSEDAEILFAGPPPGESSSTVEAADGSPGTFQSPTQIQQPMDGVPPTVDTTYGRSGIEMLPPPPKMSI